VTIPPVFSQMSKTLNVPAEVIEGAFLESNPGLKRDQITITCRRPTCRRAAAATTRSATVRCRMPSWRPFADR